MIENANQDTEGDFFAQMRLFREQFSSNGLALVFAANQPEGVRTEDQSDRFRDCFARSVSQAQAKVVYSRAAL